VLTSYAQFQEDVRLHRALQSVQAGFYIDVGANSPTFHSVTKMFYDLGWSGINIEPVPARHAELIEQRPRDINLRVAATAKAGTASFFDMEGNGLSTLVPDLATRAEGMGFQRQSYTVETRTLASIVSEHVKGEVHFLKIDAEGSEFEVVEGINFATFRPWVIVLESTDPTTTQPGVIDWEPKIIANGYVFCGNDFVNRYYAVRERPDIAAILSLPVDQFIKSENESELSHLRQAEQLLTSSLAEATKAKNEALAKVSELTDSTSWKLLSPARLIANKVKAILDRLGISVRDQRFS
jgi:FkbM family methyltransferase